MAVFHHQPAGSRIWYNGGSTEEEQLPSGSCNFRDLSNGVAAPTCGCKRFWLSRNRLGGRNEVADTACCFCFCGHHACFHDAAGQASQGGVQQQQSLGQHSTAMRGGPSQPGRTSINADSHVLQPKPSGLGIRPVPAAPEQSISTRLWDAFNAFGREQADGPTSDAGSSRLPSTAVPSVAGDPRPSPTRSMQQRANVSRSMGPPISIPSLHMIAPGAEEYSATEVATPSVQGTPDLRNFVPPASETRPLDPSPAFRQPLRRRASASPALQARPTTEDVQPATSTAPNQHSPQPAASWFFSHQEVTDLLRAYGHRIDVLENLSFSQVPLEEIQDKFENFDARILDLEHWRTDHEREKHASPEPVAPASSQRRRLLPTESGSFASDGSFDSAAAAQTEAAVLATLAANAETVPRIESLESRVADLENDALPSFTRPWHVQVVLLPWGGDLRGIWFSALDATQNSLKSSQQAPDEWTGSVSGPKTSFQSAASGVWTTESIQAWAHETQDWLSPKACGPTGTVFQRLASRGLVQDVTFEASDSGHIMNVLANHFNDMSCPAEDARVELPTGFQGLQERFVPLRKVRKSSRLRLLSPAEMVTSATWTASFLESSVIMKVNNGQRRLYMTTPEAYLQRNEGGWTWLQIRQLPMFEASGEEQAAQATSAVIEACWSYNDNLDRSFIAHTSFASHKSHRSSNLIPAHKEDDNDGQSILRSSETYSRRQRAVSLPDSGSVAAQARGSQSKRRVASYETGTTLPLDEQYMEGGVAGVAASKRRRVSRSPEAERRGVGLTPRWSREPPSPFTSEQAGEGFSQGASSRRRGNTPFAYATPHSNSTYVDRPDLLIGDGDTEADTDMAQPHSEHGEEEWNGVEDDRDFGSRGDPAESGGLGDADIDDVHTNDGETGIVPASWRSAAHETSSTYSVGVEDED